MLSTLSGNQRMLVTGWGEGMPDKSRHGHESLGEFTRQSILQRCDSIDREIGYRAGEAAISTTWQLPIQLWAISAEQLNVSIGPSRWLAKMETERRRASP